jgi:tetratricopeptide (TPR) repeat protein
MSRLVGLVCMVLMASLWANEDLFVSRSQADRDYAANRYAQAAAGYAQWLQSNAGDQEAWFRLGNSYHQLLRPMDALVAYRRAQLLKPEDARPWHNMGMLYLRLAIESYDNLRRNAPRDDPLVPYAEKVLSGILDLVSLRLQQGGVSPLKELAPRQ